MYENIYEFLNEIIISKLDIEQKKYIERQIFTRKTFSKNDRHV